jgi:hypothetical protein
MCNATAFFLYSTFRCVDVRPELRLRILFNHTLYFAEQTGIATWRPRGTLPSEWFCSMGSCRAFTSSVELFTYDPAAVAALMTPLTTVAVPLAAFHWYCLNPLRRATMLRADLAVGANGTAFRPIDELCLSCADWCGPHGGSGRVRSVGG